MQRFLESGNSTLFIIFVIYPQKCQFRLKNEKILKLLGIQPNIRVQWLISIIGEELSNAPKSTWKIILSCDGNLHFILKCPKIEEFHVRSLFCFKIDHMLFFKCPIFPFCFWKWGISKKHVINFEKEKEPKMKFIDFWTFHNFMQMLSHAKIIFHMLFGAFHVTPCTNFFISASFLVYLMVHMVFHMVIHGLWQQIYFK